MANRVLIVEDNPVIARMWEGKLSRADYDVRVAPDGQSARVAMREWCPDAVLLDVVLPETDGLSLCREWRADPENAAVKIIFVSAFSTRQDVQAARAVGADGYVPKSPQAGAKLVAMLARHLAPNPAEVNV